MLRTLLLLLLIAVLVLGASVGYFNAQTVGFDYLFGAIEVPLIALLIGAFAFGVLLTLIVVAGRLFSLHLEARRLRARIREHEIELRNLRNLPVSTTAAGAPAAPAPEAIASPALPGA